MPPAPAILKRSAGAKVLPVCAVRGVNRSGFRTDRASSDAGNAAKTMP
jgi:hypothetical protein